MGEFLSSDVFKRNIWYIVMLIAMTIVYISNRYEVQREIVEIDQLKRERLDARYEALTVSSELTVRTRQSKIENYISDKENALQVPENPPYIIKKEKK